MLAKVNRCLDPFLCYNVQRDHTCPTKKTIASACVQYKIAVATSKILINFTQN